MSNKCLTRFQKLQEVLNKAPQCLQQSYDYDDDYGFEYDYDFYNDYDFVNDNDFYYAYDYDNDYDNKFYLHFD